MRRETIEEKLIVDALFQLAVQYRSRLQAVSLRNVIVLLRKRLKMSQRMLARRAKIPQPTLSRIESGKTNPNLATLEKIYKALFCDFVLLPLPRDDLDQIVQQQIHRIAEKRVQYLKGTMALELQQPKDEVTKALISQEEKELWISENLDIWSEEELHDHKEILNRF